MDVTKKKKFLFIDGLFSKLTKLRPFEVSKNLKTYLKINYRKGNSQLSFKIDETLLKLREQYEKSTETSEEIFKKFEHNVW